MISITDSVLQRLPEIARLTDTAEQMSGSIFIFYMIVKRSEPSGAQGRKWRKDEKVRNNNINK